MFEDAGCGSGNWLSHPCGLICWVVDLGWVVVPQILPPREDGILGLGWLNSMRENIEFKDG